MPRPFSKDLVAVLGYEFHYVRERHALLLAAAKGLLEQAEKVEEDFNALALTVDQLCKGKDWRDTPQHPRLAYIFGEKGYARG